jgi:hypothetical protein
VAVGGRLVADGSGVSVGGSDVAVSVGGIGKAVPVGSIGWKGVAEAVARGLAVTRKSPVTGIGAEVVVPMHPVRKRMNSAARESRKRISADPENTPQ